MWGSVFAQTATKLQNYRTYRTPLPTRDPDPVFTPSTLLPRHLLQATSPWIFSSLQATMPKVLLVLTSASKMGEKSTGAWDIYFSSTSGEYL